MTRIMIGPAPLATVQGDFTEILTKAGFQLVYPRRRAQMTEDEVLDQYAGIPGCLAGSEPYTRKVFQQHPALKVLARVGVGYDAVDVAAATEAGCVVTVAAGTNQDAVSEHCFMLILALAKNLMKQHPLIVAGQWPRQANHPIRGLTIGLVGLGRIGKSMTVRAQAFGMKVVAYEPFPDRAFVEKHGIELLSLEELLRCSDYVSLHLPATPETHQLINAERLKLMKPTAYLVNTARGHVVDERALFEVLRDRRIAGAGLDVFEQEPPDPKHPIFALDNVVMTAHTAGVDTRSRDDMARAAADALVRLARGEWPTEYIVNPEVKDRFRWPG